LLTKDIVEEKRRYFEANGFKGWTAVDNVKVGRKLVSTFSTSEQPSLVSAISPLSGVVNFTGDVYQTTIGIIIEKLTPPTGESKYQLYLLSLLNCTESFTQSCSPIYPSQLYMVVDITGGADTQTNKTQKQTPTWLWWLIGILVVFAAILGLLGYRYWWKHRQSTEELKETNAELDAAQEENEMGFGRDLAVGDVTFNPIATGVPNTMVAPQLQTQPDRAGLIANDGKADVAVEKFKHREEFGQKMPDKRAGGVARGRPPPPPSQ